MPEWTAVSEHAIQTEARDDRRDDLLAAARLAMQAARRAEAIQAQIDGPE